MFAAIAANPVRYGWVGQQGAPRVGLQSTLLAQSFGCFPYAIVRLLRSNNPTNRTPGKLTASNATPCEALGEGVDLIIVAPGESQ